MQSSERPVYTSSETVACLYFLPFLSALPRIWTPHHSPFINRLAKQSTTSDKSRDLSRVPYTSTRARWAIEFSSSATSHEWVWSSESSLKNVHHHVNENWGCCRGGWGGRISNTMQSSLKRMKTSMRTLSWLYIFICERESRHLVLLDRTALDVVC